jgi:hypothetical protein
VVVNFKQFFVYETCKIPLTLSLSHNGEREFWGITYEHFLCYECFRERKAAYISPPWSLIPLAGMGGE